VHQLNRVRLERHRCHSVTADAPPSVDPFQLVASHLEPLGHVVRGELDSESATLRDSAQHFFGKGRAREGKRVRPVLVLLVGATTALNAPESAHPPDVETAFEKRKQLAAITEMIHTASLIHDDVLDAADTRRGDAAVHRLYSTKAAVLSGDFLLARASVMLARIGNAQVVREMSKSLEALVQGELMQLKSSAEERLSLE
jgi:geranyl diphosphate synthase